MLKMDAEAIDAFFEAQFPQAVGFLKIEALSEGRVETRLSVTNAHLRPGGTVSGPTLMSVSDTVMYYLVLSHVGPVALAVTTHLGIDFLRRPRPDADILATGELLKLGKRLAMGRVTLRSEGDPAPVAHATVTYALPPDAKLT